MLAIWLLLDASATAHARGNQGNTPPAVVVLDGAATEVSWKDGDTFHVRANRALGRRRETARIVGYNTLESYGPVHGWGTWTGHGLLALAKAATARAAAGTWRCQRLGEQDRYGRQKVRCPDLALALISEGLAHVFAVEPDPPDPALLAAQRSAQRRGVGLWKNGIPDAIVTSVHSMDEPNAGDTGTVGHSADPGPPQSYNRVCDAATGQSRLVPHRSTYRVCERWCFGGSCMTYVPFERRYRGKPWCLADWPPRTGDRTGAE